MFGISSYLYHISGCKFSGSLSFKKKTLLNVSIVLVIANIFGEKTQESRLIAFFISSFLTKSVGIADF